MSRIILTTPFTFHRLYRKEPFTPMQAYIDLLLRCAAVDGKSIKRGQFEGSGKQLAQDWQWTAVQVKEFIHDLGKHDEIDYVKEGEVTTFTLLKYESFTDKLEDQKEYRENLLNDRNKNFKESLFPFCMQYGGDVVKAFYDYWAEPNKSRTKMRWELEKTWDLKKRLARWATTNKQFDKKEEKPSHAGNFFDKDKTVTPGAR